jgi:ParB family chromosome partitioning protein
MPAKYLELVRAVLGGVDLDPASCDVAQEIVQANRYFSEEDDALSKEWPGRIWLNLASGHPHIAKFVEKLVTEYGEGRLTAAIMLTHNYTDTDWFYQATDVAEAICFTKGRAKVIEPDGDTCALPTCGQCFLYYGNDAIGFARQFSKLGTILVPSRHL